MYLYESHLGGVFATTESIDWGYLYCDSCGDSDQFIGYFETEEELKELLNGLKHYSKKYINEIVKQWKAGEL